MINIQGKWYFSGLYSHSDMGFVSPFSRVLFTKRPILKINKTHIFFFFRTKILEPREIIHSRLGIWNVLNVIVLIIVFMIFQCKRRLAVVVLKDDKVDWKADGMVQEMKNQQCASLNSKLRLNIIIPFREGNVRRVKLNVFDLMYMLFRASEVVYDLKLTTLYSCKDHLL